MPAASRVGARSVGGDRPDRSGAVVVERDAAAVGRPRRRARRGRSSASAVPRPVGVHDPEARSRARAAEIGDLRAVRRPVRKGHRLRHPRQRLEPASVGTDEVEVVVAVRVGVEGDRRAVDRPGVGRRRLDRRRRGRRRGTGRPEAGRTRRLRQPASRSTRERGRQAAGRGRSRRLIGSSYTDRPVVVPGRRVSCGADRGRPAAA